MRKEEEIKELIETFKRAIERTTGRVDYPETMKRRRLREKIRLLQWVLEN
jgi:ribosomal protein S6